ncbi:hypothetical protein [Microbacterium maritypicum]|uniref:hypothetical protein n=1 Tax=Microbacterium maritypicum TaxID=33918 RepID=UPI00296E3386|nr:hypothetical protein [Microbacterium liquefaciens]
MLATFALNARDDLGNIIGNAQQAIVKRTLKVSTRVWLAKLAKDRTPVQNVGQAFESSLQMTDTFVVEPCNSGYRVPEALGSNPVESREQSATTDARNTQLDEVIKSRHR